MKSDAPKPSSEGERIKVYVDAYSLLIELFSLLVNVQKDYKRTLAGEIEKKMVDMVRVIALANETREHDIRIGHIAEVSCKVEDVKLLITKFPDNIY